MSFTRRALMHWFGWLTFLLLCFTQRAEAINLTGGELTLQSLGPSGQFRVQLTLYLTGPGAGPNSSQNVTLYQKSNLKRMQQVTVSLQDTVSNNYSEAPCNRLSYLNQLVARYQADVQLDPNLFSDPGGYYAVYEGFSRRFCTNIVGAGMVLPVEFNPFQAKGRNGQLNSTPRFSFSPLIYACLGKSFRLVMSASDSDGDSLAYRLVAPLQRFFNNAQGFVPINWASGYSTDQPLGGLSSLRFDSNTGIVELIATTIGFYQLSVEVEEWRNGKRLGAVRRDFLLPVINCYVPVSPMPVVRYDTSPVSTLVLCPNTEIKIAADSNSRYAYQWLKDNQPVPGATSNSILISSVGSYSVKQRYKDGCNRDTISKPVMVVPLETVSILSQTAPPYCTGDTVKLVGQIPADYTVGWSLGKQLLPKSTGNTINVVRSGWYFLRASPPLVACQSVDSVFVEFSPRPSVTLTASSSNLCTGDSIQINATEGAGFQYAWSPGAATGSGSKIIVRKGGAYKVAVTNQAGCKTESATVRITETSLPIIGFDSIRPLCVYDVTPIALVAQPAGGVFSGTTIQGTTFITNGLKPGNYPVTYTYKSPEGCTNTKKQWVTILDAPSVRLADTFTVLKGNTIKIPLFADGQNTYVWTPQDFLIDGQQSSSPTSQPASSILYSVVTTNAAGCSTSSSTYIRVLDGLYIPNAFTPNGDGENDRWELVNIQSFPNCTVTIYNRWGEVVYYSKGYGIAWDGRYMDKQVLPGAYTYTITITDWNQTYTGKVFVLY